MGTNLRPVGANAPRRASPPVSSGAAQGPENRQDSERHSFSAPPVAPGYTVTATGPTKVHAASIFGRMKPVVAGTLVAATLATGCVSVGAPLPAYADEVHEAPPAAEQVVEQPARDQRGIAHFNRQMVRLERMHAEGEISADQMAAARAQLYRAFVLGVTEGVPKDEQGRVTLESVLRGDPASPEAGRSRGQIVRDQLTRDLERRMRITARDMATGDYAPIDGLPGYKQVPEDQVRRLLKDAFERMPIGELPFGPQLARTLEALPGLDDVDVARMSYDELRDELRDDARDYLDARFGDFVDEHKIELGVVAFAAVTGLRAASPEAAALIDDLGLRVDAWRERSDDGRLETRGRLVWRDQHVLPDLDVEGQAHTRVGDYTTLRAGLRGTLSLEAEDPFTGTATVGAHYGRDHLWLDAQGTYTYPEDSWRASVTGGYTNPETSFRASASATALFGDGVAVGDANGRGRLQLELGQDLDLGGDAQGYWGFYGGVSADTDGSHEDVGLGLVFRVQF